ncbi:MAG: elongation factor G [Candidatus Saganbacteria bacterium]|nr:elongation factor G [Candidatus Saganbacteria bacterium]
MKQYPPDKIRNVGIIGSGTTGKTSLSEALLFTAKAINRQGGVLDGTTTSDYDPEEIKRQISIHSSLLPLEWKDHKINLIDTPGFIDFVGDAISTMRIVDCLIIVVDAVTGHGGALDNLWKMADNFDLPRIIVVNKMDKSQADFDKTIEMLREKFSKEIVPVQVPVGQEGDFSGAHSLLKHEVPENLKESVALHKEMMIEGIAEIDDTILTEYLENKEITEEELTEHLITALDHDKIFPVFCASAAKNIGSDEILDAIVSWMPPANEKEVPAENLDGQEVKVKPDDQEPFSAYVFKTVNEAHIGNLAYIRVYSGTIKPSSPVYNATKGKDERIGQIISMRGKTRVDIPQLTAGDIAVLPKLKVTGTGDTLCDKNRKLFFKPAEFPEPVMSFSVRPKSKAEQEKMGLGLSAITHEDPTFKMSYNPETKETVISGMGDVHLEVILKRIRERYGVEIEIGEPRIPYKETIMGRSKGQGKYKKQTGGRGQYGDTWLEIEPLPRGQGFEFVNKIVGGAIPKNYIPAVEKGIKEAMTQGVIAGYPAIDIKITLYDGSYHEVDSSDMAFKIAASMGFKKIFVDAKPVLLEPIVEITVSMPPEFVGEVTGDLNKRRGRISNIETDKIVALVPQSELSKYATDLRSFTHGQGSFSTKFSHYEQVPPQTQQKLVEIYQKIREAGGVER